MRFKGLGVISQLYKAFGQISKDIVPVAEVEDRVARLRNDIMTPALSRWISTSFEEELTEAP